MVVHCEELTNNKSILLTNCVLYKEYEYTTFLVAIKGKCKVYDFLMNNINFTGLTFVAFIQVFY